MNKLLRNKIDLQIFQKSNINALSGLVAEIYKNQNKYKTATAGPSYTKGGDVWYVCDGDLEESMTSFS